MRDQSAHSVRGGQIRWRIHGAVFGPSFASDNCYSRQLKGHAGWVRSAAFSPNGKRVVTASYDNTARIWDVIVRGDDLRERVCAGTLVGLAQEFTDAELEDPILRGIDKDDFVACNPCLGRGPLSLDSAADTILALVASRCLCEPIVRPWRLAFSHRAIALNAWHAPSELPCLTLLFWPGQIDSAEKAGVRMRQPKLTLTPADAVRSDVLGLRPN